jgi:hypothetical protein
VERFSTHFQSKKPQKAAVMTRQASLPNTPKLHATCFNGRKMVMLFGLNLDLLGRNQRALSQQLGTNLGVFGSVFHDVSNFPTVGNKAG